MSDMDCASFLGHRAVRECEFVENFPDNAPNYDSTQLTNAYDKPPHFLVFQVETMSVEFQVSLSVSLCPREKKRFF